MLMIWCGNKMHGYATVKTVQIVIPKYTKTSKYQANKFK